MENLSSEGEREDSNSSDEEPRKKRVKDSHSSDEELEQRRKDSNSSDEEPRKKRVKDSNGSDSSDEELEQYKKMLNEELEELKRKGLRPALWPAEDRNSVLQWGRLVTHQRRIENVLQNLRASKLDVNNATSTTDLRDKLNKIASDKGFIVCDNEESGNCLFYALSEQLDLVKGIKISHEDLRLKLVQYLRENPTLSDGTELFNFVDGYSSWPDYLKKMANLGTWGDHVVLHAAANRFKTSIQVISSLSHNHNQTITPECHSDSIDRLVLGHVHELHYVSLRPRHVQGKQSSACVF